MHELHEAIPDPQVVLALEPEELGAKLLFLLRMRQETDPRPFNPRNCLIEIKTAGDESRGSEGYPRDIRDEIVQAVSEAFAWLQAQALIIADHGNGGWYSLSRRARRFESEEDFFQYSLAQMLPQKAWSRPSRWWKFENGLRWSSVMRPWVEFGAGRGRQRA